MYNMQFCEGNKLSAENYLVFLRSEWLDGLSKSHQDCSYNQLVSALKILDLLGIECVLVDGRYKIYF